MKYLRHERGFTLIELIVSMALVALVGLGATSIMVFGARTFRSSGTQHNLQVESRITMEMLVSDVRYAVNLEIIDTDDLPISFVAPDADGVYSNVGPFDTYLFFDKATETVVKLRRSSLERFPLSSSALNPLSFNAITPLNATTPHVLEYELLGTQGTLSNTFSLSSRIVLLNIRERHQGISGTSGTAIRYTSPAAHLSEIHYPVIEVVQVDSGDYKVVVRFSVLIGEDLYPREVTIESYYVDSKDNKLTVDNLTFSPPPLTGSGAEYEIEFKSTGGHQARTRFADEDEILLNVRYGGAGEGYYLASYVLHYARQNDNIKEWQVR